MYNGSFLFMALYWFLLSGFSLSELRVRFNLIYLASNNLGFLKFLLITKP